MVKRMLVDASHAEETRVVVANGTRLEEFDFESAARKQLKGNIYLAKVMRVEPSLQAAFVDYGGNRHGFLPFSEIHPDYYQIPVADREALFREQEEAPEIDDADDADDADDGDDNEDADETDETDETDDDSDEEAGGDDEGGDDADEAEVGDESSSTDSAEKFDAEAGDNDLEAAAAEDGADNSDGPAIEAGEEGEKGEAEGSVDAEAEAGDTDPESEPEDPAGSDEETENETPRTVALEDPAPEVSTRPRGRSRRRKRKAKSEGVEEIGGDEIEDIERRRARASRSLLSRRYRIQEVIKKRQILLVQVVKEERGNKGAALTSYLSLAGRYCVLMPNAVRGGGISRKITSQEDRKRLKSILAELEVPTRMGVIVRTAGTARSKAEIRRDFEYLMRQWEKIREQTLNSIAPSLIYEEGNLIKRSIRDLYTRDVDQILVEGEDGYRVAKDFMRMLIPSHTAKVQPYRDLIPLFARYQVESQLDSMYSPEVQLKSGGYLVINSTEALVAIDVNSGRATRERNIEETALKTNLEAAGEVARQLRLRDLAGLIVVDFIDMEENRNQRAVERKLKEAMRADRARIQIGRISPFGLLEMSRQRLRPSLTEASMETCGSCGGAGIVRSIGSSAVHVLRAIEEEGLRSRSAAIRVHVPARVAYYVLNKKRKELGEIEDRCRFEVDFAEDDALVPPMYNIERLRARDGDIDDDDMPAIEAEADVADSDEDGGKRGKKRRRRRRGRKDDTANNGKSASQENQEADSDQSADPNAASEGGEAGEDGESPPRKRRRRGKRGGRRRSARRNAENAENGENGENAVPEAESDAASESVTQVEVSEDAEPATSDATDDVAEAGGSAEDDKPAEKPRRRRSRSRSRRKADEGSESGAEAEAKPSADDTADADTGSAGATEAEQPNAEAAAEVDSAPETAATEADSASQSNAEGETEEPKAEEEAPRPARRGWWQRKSANAGDD